MIIVYWPVHDQCSLSKHLVLYNAKGKKNFFSNLFTCKMFVVGKNFMFLKEVSYLHQGCII